jgi:hypothetical protein
MSLDDILSKQRSPHNQCGLGYVSNATKKKKNKKKSTVSSFLPNLTAFVKEGEMSKVNSSLSKAGVSGVSRPESPGKPESPARKTGVSAPTHNDFAGKYNPSYVLCRDYNGHVYAKYVGPYDGYIEWAIWVPKILVTNAKGPIQKWVPKSKH